MTLKEKLSEAFTLNQLESVADEHAVRFAVWLDKNKRNYKGLFLEQLLEIYKNESKY